MTPESGPSPRDHARAQTETIAVVLLLFVSALAVTLVVAAGSGALDDAERTLDVERATQAMTRLDADVAAVALDGGPARRTALGDSGGGQYVVREDAGWVRIVHRNYSGGADEVVYNGTLGAVVFRRGDATVAYQGGGVWRKNGNGSVMVSPPELYYVDETFVYAGVQVTGSGATTGSTDALVSRVGSTDVYPDRDHVDDDGPGAPYDATAAPYHNPVRGGTVTVTIKSRYYRGWAVYLRERVDGAVTVDHANRTVTLELVAPQTLGFFEMPNEGNAIKVRGVDGGHPLEEFTVDLVPDQADAAKFDNLQWSMYADEGPQEFEVHLKLTGPVDDTDDTACKEQHIAATVYYSDTNGNTYHGWHADTAFQTTCVDRDGDGVDDDVVLHANLTGTTELTLTALSNSDLEHFNPQGAPLTDPVEFDQHAGSVAWEPVTFGGGDEAAVGDAVEHYFELLGPNYDLVVDDKNSETVEEDRSSGVLLYDGSGRITFMHVGEQRVEVTLK